MRQTLAAGFDDLRRTLGGLKDIVKPLAKLGLYREFQVYGAVKRAHWLLGEGREDLIKPGDIASMNELERRYPFIDIRPGK